MPPHSASLNLHILNLIHQLQASGHTRQVCPWGGTNLTPTEKHGHLHDAHANNTMPVLLISKASILQTFYKKVKISNLVYILIYKMLLI